MKFKKNTIIADILLILVAIIWGIAFVFQRSCMQVIGPFAFSAARFGLGAIVLLPIYIYTKCRQTQFLPVRQSSKYLTHQERALWSISAGTVLFIAVSLQQTGLVYTTAGNAGFITCIYVVLVPLFGLILGKAAIFRIWIGAALALVGLYILSIGTGFQLASGDILELVGAFFWAGHILIIGHISPRIDTIELSAIQFVVCSFLSFITAMIWEPNAFSGLSSAASSILYAGILSTVVAYNLQIIAQRSAHPAHASVIFSMEALFAAIGGVLFLQEPVTLRLVIGGALMFIGMIFSQLEPKKPFSIADYSLDT